MPNVVLLTGATGYVGGTLLPILEAQGHEVRCLARRPEHLSARLGPRSRAIAGDVLDPESLGAAMHGVDSAYYLVHSMGSSGEFEAQDRRAAENFARAAETAGVRRIIYLGGLGLTDPTLSAHLRSRHEVGAVLRDGAVPVVEFRASIVIGPGSLSFEMVRALVERLPVMITPRWVDTPAQPIAVDDLIAYLLAALEIELPHSRVFEIGGSEAVSYGAIMREYARQRDLRRWMIRVPVLTPRLSSLWLGLVTPLYARVGRKLVDSMRHATVVTDDAAQRAFSVRPMGLADAIGRALHTEEHGFATKRWSDSMSASGPLREWGGVRFGNRLVDARRQRVRATAAVAFAAIERIGGNNGWYYGDWLWTLRGWLDLLMGGVGMRRGRANPNTLHAGDVLDCWRVETVEPGRKLVLSAEMRMPGRAWLQFDVETDGEGVLVHQTASFDPVGLSGLAYWYSVWPLHQFVFEGMLRGICERASETRTDAPRSRSTPGET